MDRILSECRVNGKAELLPAEIRDAVIAARRASGQKVYREKCLICHSSPELVNGNTGGKYSNVFKDPENSVEFRKWLKSFRAGNGSTSWLSLIDHSTSRSYPGVKAMPPTGTDLQKSEREELLSWLASEALSSESETYACQSVSDRGGESSAPESDSMSAKPASAEGAK